MPQFSSTRLKVADLPQNRPTAFHLTPDRARMTEIAAALGLSELRKLRFEGEIASAGKTDWQLHARLGATVVQPCVVTLAPVTTRIEDEVTRRFVAHLPEEAMEGEEIEMPEDDSIEKLGVEIDLDAVMTEALALALPLYPRADGAALETVQFTEPGKAPMTDEDARPFAGLAALRDKLESDE
ncbi:YceD family protein [Marimonas arenosa]|uniref:DUF177 domain-containing protein n=1 Tax=Marimonas arenosa TaxID=1795305 RepID=A0AAE3WAW8_9RHOB|nr:DUF177 domain-containing protein [Marimonas arenosa]MDQ2088442.1 DUF177 domain-containing protein [Marimonas arenosa]